MWVDGPSPLWYSEKSLVVDNWGYHSEKAKEGKITLTAGVHKVYGMMFQGEKAAVCIVKYKGPDTKNTYDVL